MTVRDAVWWGRESPGGFEIGEVVCLDMRLARWPALEYMYLPEVQTIVDSVLNRLS
jgi:hypothetical protein